jgi:hypothetical protein
LLPIARTKGRADSDRKRAGKQ